jgi:hypothetical protein
MLTSSSSSSSSGGGVPPSDTIVQFPGSPISPRSVVALNNDSTGFSGPDLKFPAIRHHDADEETTSTAPAEDPNSSINSIDYGGDEGSTIFYGRYLFTPPDHILQPILRTLLAANMTLTSRERRISNVIVDDVLEHQLYLAKSGDNIFSGYLGTGQRIVVVRMSGGGDDHPQNEDLFTVHCPGKMPVETFLRYLRAHDILVKKLD